ncbi:hypothetical protein N656DRAFT_802723 [Canariomyces notabilis]|uniref:RGS domain-containing protein n=1 Tax=Canariomyces notabilis TaxID=2074819 RepID=A0AAN6QD73_9PEZI|nr:hypothetical protein N656DRAFT_802723 [Canariomyces arenarius]
MRFTFPSWLSWYKKPEYRDFKEYANNVSSGKRSLSPDGRKSAIPSRLRLDRILANKTCSPMSLYDFYMYLQYIEFSAENLEFYIWFKSYEAAYAKGLTGINDKGYGYGSLPSAAASASSVVPIKCEDSQEVDDDDDYTEVEAGTSKATLLYPFSPYRFHFKTISDIPFPYLSGNEALEHLSQLISTSAVCTTKGCTPFSMSLPQSLTTATLNPTPKPPTTASTAPPPSTTSKKPKGKPDPLYDLTTITSIFLLPSSPKELNIPPALRDQALAALSSGTTHPDALKPVADHVYSLMRNCSHRNFVRLGVGNGTFETVCVATLLGCVSLFAGFLLVLMRGFVPFRGSQSRWEVWAAWPLWWMGVSLVLSGLRGSCFFLLLFGRRQRLPWERIEEGGDDHGGGGGEGKGGSGMAENRQRKGFSLRRALGRLMIFDRRLQVKEKHLRRLQRKIVLQSLAGGGVFATLGVVLFVFLPIWKETV